MVDLDEQLKRWKEILEHDDDVVGGIDFESLIAELRALREYAHARAKEVAK